MGYGDTLFNGNRVERAFKWSPFATATELPLPPLAISTEAICISNSRIITGFSTLPDGVVVQTVWENGNHHTLGILFANGRIVVNDSGIVAGRFSDYPGFYHAYGIKPLDKNANGIPDTWFEDLNCDGKNDLMEHLALFDRITGLGGGSLYNPYGINNKNQITGAGEGPNGGDVAVLYDYNSNTEIGLGDLGGNNSAGIGVNDHGSVTGSSFTRNGQEHAFIWLETSSYGLPAQQMIDLTPQFIRSTSFSINEWGKIVGQAHFPGLPGERAFVWDPYTKQISDLNSLINPIPGLHLSRAVGINDREEIIVDGILNGHSRAFYLHPSPSTGIAITAQVTQILAGLIDDSGGVIWTINGPIHVDPWNPMNRIAPENKDILLITLLNEVADSIADASVRKAIQKTNWETVIRLINKKMEKLNLEK